MGQVNIAKTWVVEADQVLDIPVTDTATIYGLSAPYSSGNINRADPTLINYGEIRVTTKKLGPTFLFVDTASFWRDVTIENHGLISVHSDQSSAAGIWAPSWSPSFDNSGQFLISAPQGRRDRRLVLFSVRQLLCPQFGAVRGQRIFRAGLQPLDRQSRQFRLDPRRQRFARRQRGGHLHGRHPQQRLDHRG
jgi:hypothetical protein